MNDKRIIVDEEEPETDVDDPTFNSAGVQVRTDRWVSDEFEIQDFLGRGKFGEVKRCSDLTTGAEFAAKFICTPRAEDKKDVEHEVNVMRRLSHKRLVQLYDAFEARSEMCIVLEIINGGELFDRVVSDEFLLTEKACACIVRQICEGVEYMHSIKMIHLDLKPENILCVTKEGNRVKIIDFGLAREFDPKKETRVLFGTPEFMAPEVILFDPIHFATDMWSIGVMCYVLLSGLSPFMGSNDTATLGNVTKGKFSFDYREFKGVSSEAKDFIRRLLLLDKLKRMTAEMCLEHQWLKKPVSDAESTNLDLSKQQMKAFICRRKWQKAFNVIVALRRMRPKISTVHNSSVVAPWRPSVASACNPSVRIVRNKPIASQPHELANRIQEKPSASSISHLTTGSDKTDRRSKISNTTTNRPYHDKSPKADVTSRNDVPLLHSEPTQRATALVKTSKEKDNANGHRGQLVFKQANKNSMPNFLKLRSVFSNNRT